MAKWVNADVLDFGINNIKTAAIRMLLLNNYTLGDSYATVIAGSNILATVTMASGDYAIAASGNNRTLTTLAKSVTATASSSTPDLHIGFTNGVDKVLWVTDETTNQTVTNGNTINFPAIVYQSNQPT